MGGPKILALLDSLAKSISAQAAAGAKRFAQLRLLVGMALAISLLSLVGVLILLLR
jgi:F0F1-type ATP synthase membrane subunit c/vacuolar-type H+-ATPase subunit K